MTDILEELIDTSDNRKVKCLKPSPDIPEGVIETLILNEEASEVADSDFFKCLGAFFAFSFLTGQSFGVELAPAVWKQIVGDKILIEDLMKIDQSAYHRLIAQFPNGGPELDKAVSMYFDQTREQVESIRKGMDLVLGGKLNAIAYMPLKNFSERINGMPDFKIEDLKKITKF